MNVMPTDELIRRVTDICRKNGVNHLKLFGSFATGTATPRSDIWMDILNSRNQLAHDYAGTLAETEFQNIIGPYCDESCRFRYTASKYMIEDE